MGVVPLSGILETKELTALCHKGVAELELTQDGHLLYVFKDSLSDHEKSGSQSPWTYSLLAFSRVVGRSTGFCCLLLGIMGDAHNRIACFLFDGVGDKAWAAERVASG